MTVVSIYRGWKKECLARSDKKNDINITYM